MDSDCQGRALSMGTRSQRERDKVRELCAGPALCSAQRATGCLPGKGNAPTFVPVPKTQTIASDSTQPCISKGLFRHASQLPN